MRSVGSDLWYDDAVVFRPCTLAVVESALAGMVLFVMGFGPLVMEVVTGRAVTFSGPGSEGVIAAVLGIPLFAMFLWQVVGMARGYVAVGNGGIELRGAVGGRRVGWREVRTLIYVRRKGRMSSITVLGGKRSICVNLREFRKEEAARLEALIRSHVPEGLEEEWGAVCPEGCVESAPGETLTGAISGAREDAIQLPSVPASPGGGGDWGFFFLK